MPAPASSSPATPARPCPRPAAAFSAPTSLEDVKGGQADSVESGARYLGYASRLRNLLLASHRYLAYTSDVGEAFRPVAHPYLIRGAYALSWAYLTADVGYEGWKAKKAGSDNALVASTAVKRSVFQALASMALPAFTIHGVVRFSGALFKNAANRTLRTWGPTALGLAVVPVLPYMFDHPVEAAVDAVFEAVEDRVFHRESPKMYHPRDERAPPSPPPPGEAAKKDA